VGFARAPLFLDIFGRDLLLVDGPVLSRVAVEAVMIGEFDVPAVTSQLQLSPGGTYVAIREEPRTDEEETATYHIGRAGTRLTRVRADDAVFTGERHVLVAVSDARGTTVRGLALDEAHDPPWEQHVPDLRAPRLSFTRGTRRWHVTGWTGDRTLVRVEGDLDAAGLVRTEWPASPSEDGWIDAFSATREGAIVVEARYDPGPLAALIPPRWKWIWLVAAPGRRQTRYAAIDRRGTTELGTSRLGASCESGLLQDDALLCTVFDGTRTRLVSIDASGRVGALGWFHGAFVGDGNAAPGWLTGWTGATPVAIRLGSRDIIALDDRTIGRITLAGDHLAALTYDGARTKVRTYVVHRPGGNAAQARLRSPRAARR
jgi:hypothetical protein